MAITTKKVLKWIWTEFKREMVIQKPDPAMLARMAEMRMVSKPELTIGQKAIRGGNRAVKIWFFMGMALIVWVAIHI
jgi:hypothetical protein